MQSDTTKSTNSTSERPVVTRRLDNFFLGLADVASFIGRFFREAVMPPYEFKEIIRQCYEVGFRSLLLISTTGFITGIVFTNQSRPSLSEFGATSWLPSLIAIAIVRALGPLVTALIAAGKVGSSIGAELGSMNVTEQIDAMEVSGTDPFKFLVVSRVIATSFTIPLLTMYTIFVGLLGAYINVSQNEQTSFVSFMQEVFGAITYLDIFASILKSTVFGFTIGMVGCYKGYHSSKGTEGVGKAANSAVVTSMFLVFIEELLSLQIIGAIRGS
ncbi:MlaE family ABC transporter permease [Spirosoma pollinicola]|uniref:ABC transporter permease n=1 Tax=Spirosoma pollinicola TaxID=2057025 RepID=A0A2K8YTU2_9BACT|nr:ABC transporter permease [Spirosoma pollinicola]AUD01052.1 ABC transporter permease [Spirosoma pollinicola]